MTTDPEDHLQHLVRQAGARTNELRTRLSVVARALSASYRDVARQHDRLAVNRRRPSRFDHTVAAKSWRALADKALLTARAWEDGDGSAGATLACPRCTKPVPPEIVMRLALGAAPIAACPACGAGCELAVRLVAGTDGAPTDDVTAAIADEDQRVADELGAEVVPKLFAVGLRLSGVLPMATGRVHERLVDAIDDLDDSIRSIRRVAFGLTKEAGRDSPERPSR